MGLTKKNQMIADCLYDAYIYGYPLVTLGVQIDAVTNTEYPTSDKAPMNQLIHAKGLADAEEKYISMLNMDTVYSQIYFDLKKEPLYLYKPATDRYTIAEIIDAYGDYVDILGTGATGGNDEVKAVLIGPDYEGEAPEGFTIVKMPTNIGWTLIRIIQYGQDDMENVKTIQHAFDVRPFSAYGTDYVQPKGVYKPENDYIPLDKMQEIDIETFFRMFNRLIGENVGRHPDEHILNAVEPYGVGAGKYFSLEQFDDELQQELMAFRDRAVASFTKDVQENRQGKFVDGWVLPDERLADYGTDYEYRANTIWRGLGANPIWMAYCPTAATDSRKRLLHSDYRYRLHFTSPPPVDGFWSLTIYGEDRYLLENEIRRTGINDRSKFHINEDGSFDILIQREKPDEEFADNWLPSGKKGFLLVLRCYLAREEILNESWKLPAIERID